MTQSSMSIQTFMATARRLPPDTTVLLRGETGIGKSTVVRQLARFIAAAEKIADYPVIDRRLSQMSEGDLVGLPSTDGETTRFNPPDWYKKACKQPCVLFLDELNRATHEVMQSAFQIVLDRELNGWKLHPQTRVYSAINIGGNYTVNEVDPALLDRFWVVDLKPTLEDFLAYARGEGEMLPVIPDFVQAHEKFLDPGKNVEPGSKTTTRRSWERLSRALIHAGLGETPMDPAFYPVCIGYIGVEATIAFTDFAKTQDNRVNGENVVEEYGKYRPKVKKLTHDRLNGLIEKVAEYVTKNLTTLTETQGKNVQRFMEDLTGEHRISCWGKMTAQGLDKLELAKSLHKYCAKSILDVFGVPMGEAGVGITPNIPGIFKASVKDEKSKK